MNESYQDWLQHYGIPGMKWGQKNGPPYPLGASQYSYKERKERARAYNKELRSARSYEFKKADAKVRRAEAKYQEEKDKIITRSRDEYSRDYKLKNLEEKYKQQMSSQEMEEARRIIEKGHEKTKEILSRADKEGGFDLKTSTRLTQYGIDVPATVAEMVGMNLLLKVMGSPFVYIGYQGKYTDVTDKYKVKAQK